MQTISLPLIELFSICLQSCGLVHVVFTSGCSPVHVIRSLWLSGALSGWILCPLQMLLLVCFRSTFSLPDATRCSRYILRISCRSLRTSSFSKDPWFLSLQDGIHKPSSGPWVRSWLPGVAVFRTSQQVVIVLSVLRIFKGFKWTLHKTSTMMSATRAHF